MAPVSLLSVLLVTATSCSSYRVDGYVHSKPAISAKGLSTTAAAGIVSPMRTNQNLIQIQTIPEVPSCHDRIRCESLTSSILDKSREQNLMVASLASAPSTISIPSSATMSPLEAWCLSHLDRWYAKSQSMKCPFLRRRLGDFLDNVEKIMKHTVIRREVWPLMGAPQAWRPAGHNKKQRTIKYKNRSLEELKQYVHNDWKAETGKGYYVTGKLTTAIYRDDCLFLGPDPDMPIRGLRKYVGVAAHLFDSEKSQSILKSLSIVGDTMEAEWQLSGILRLPWRPELPTFCGKTIYYFDEEGLIERHEEEWDMTAVHAFCQTLLPDLAAKIWKEVKEPAATTVQ